MCADNIRPAHYFPQLLRPTGGLINATFYVPSVPDASARDLRTSTSFLQAVSTIQSQHPNYIHYHPVSVWNSDRTTAKSEHVGPIRTCRFRGVKVRTLHRRNSELRVLQLRLSIDVRPKGSAISRCPTKESSYYISR